jgi:hypothetical protein
MNHFVNAMSGDLAAFARTAVLVASMAVVAGCTNAPVAQPAGRDALRQRHRQSDPE